MKNNNYFVKNLDKKSKLLSLKAFSKFFVKNYLIGNFDSNFKGNGIEFNDIREYIRGDDFRKIYWKASTNGKLYVKNYIETKENNFLIILENSKTLNYGTNNFKKKDGLIEFASIILYYAMITNNNFGFISLDKYDIDKFIIPTKKNYNFNIIIEYMLNMKFNHDIIYESYDNLFNFILKRLNKRTIIFFLSDFYNFDFSKKAKIIAKKHDCIAINFLDISEIYLKKAGFIRFSNHKRTKNSLLSSLLYSIFKVYDESLLIDTESEKVRQEYKNICLEREKIKKRNLESLGFDFFTITNEKANAVETSIISFLEKRKKSKIIG